MFSFLLIRVAKGSFIPLFRNLLLLLQGAAVVLSFTSISAMASSPSGLASDSNENAGGIVQPSEPLNYDLKNPERSRSTIWPQLASFLLPGFDQWWEGQNKAALVYSGIALGGILVVDSSGGATLNKSSAANQLSEGSDGVRAYILGNKIFETAGELSLYHSFRSAVRTRQAKGEYAFLSRENEETPEQLMLAPFHFSFLERPTSYIPIGVAALLVGASTTFGHQMRLSDGFYAPSNAYCAGVGEESLFRGYINPQLMEGFNNFFWSNTTASLLFGAAHIASDNQVPVSQFLFGWYLGWLTQRNQWTISEGIFIHAWWDTILLLYQLSDHTSVTKPVILPLFSASF